PGGTQQVRILLRRPADLAPGEYRSHLWIITETKPEGFSADGADASRSFKLSIQPSLTMPVFVRHGNLDVSAQISDVRYSAVPGGGSVSFVLNRTGNRSLYGDINIICTGGGEYEAHNVRG